MAAKENDPDYTSPPPEVDVFAGTSGRGASATDATATATAPAPPPAAADPAQSTQPAGPSTTTDSKPIEKTISCVSCRKRKLKCDRVKPKCGTCTRLRHDCEYPERRRNLGSKRRNMKELEARLAQVETQLVSEQNKGATDQHTTNHSLEADWNDLTMDMNLDIDLGNDMILDGTFDMNSAGFEIPPTGPTIPMGDFFSQELLELGLQEPLPPQEMMDELHQVYFDKFHRQMPMMHKYRYYASLSKSLKFRPPICLRYAMWAVAASLTEKYRCYADLLYERARRYIQDAEMKGHGEAFVSVYHAQTWGLISNYEAKKTYFSRSWMSTGRMVRLIQMLGLYRLDIECAATKQILPPARDWIELEERRRTFWAAYYGDRWASSGTGWPMLINEDEIHTNLPTSEESFEQGVVQPSISLAQALTLDGAKDLSPFAGVILSATLFGHNFQHLYKSGPDEHPDDLANGEFWKRHRKMDNVLSNTFMFLPDHLRLPAAVRNMNVVFLHMNIHASTVCLHQAAIVTAEKHSLDKDFIKQCQARCVLAAQEIANIMRLVCHVDPVNMHPWIGFCLYVSAGVFLKDLRSESCNPNSKSNLEFVISAMRSIGTKHSITNHFRAQVELDMQATGVGNVPHRPSATSAESLRVPSMAMNSLQPDRGGLPMTYDNLQNLIGKSSSIPMSGCLPRGTSTPNSGESPDVPSEPSSNWDSGMKSALDSVLDMNTDSPQPTAITPSTSSNPLFDQIGINQYMSGQIGGAAVLLSGKAPNNQPSPGTSMQYPIRSSTPNTQQKSTGPGFPWPNTAAVVGSDITSSNYGMSTHPPNGWSLPDENQGKDN